MSQKSFSRKKLSVRRENEEKFVAKPKSNRNKHETFCSPSGVGVPVFISSLFGDLGPGQPANMIFN